MIAGCAALVESGGRARRVLGVDACAEPDRDPRAGHCGSPGARPELIGVRRELTEADVELDERYHAGDYGIPDEATLDGNAAGARTEGMVTDPVYEGKSMAAMIDLVARGEIGADATVLYAHLGGQPALNGYSALFQ